jgi:hypothetical protein
MSVRFAEHPHKILLSHHSLHRLSPGNQNMSPDSRTSCPLLPVPDDLPLHLPNPDPSRSCPDRLSLLPRPDYERNFSLSQARREREK